MDPTRRLVAVSAALLSVVALAACGGAKKSSTTSSAPSSTAPAATTPATSAADPAVEKLVPAAIRSKGTITVAADASYAPNEFIAPDGHTVIGMDPDLVKALAAVMGLKVNVVNATFATIIPGLAAGKYDMGASSFTDTKAREKTVNFVDYFTAGESFYAKANSGVSIASIADICGKTVAVEKGTTEEADAGTQGKKCKAAGKPGVTVLSFNDQNGANLAVSSGRAQLGFADSPVAAYQVKQSSGTFKLVGAPYASAPYGLALPKSPNLAPAVLAALKDLQKNGTYMRILTKWGIQAGAIPASQMKINGATS